jgi:SAM-dependent methyltransferase
MGASKPEFDEFAAEYAALLRDPIRDRFAAGSRFFAVRKWELIEQFFARTGRDLKRVRWLDVGCGLGELLQIGGPSVQQAAGCDPSSEMVQRCGGLDVRLQSSLESLPYPDQTFDFVTAVCVFHHVEPAMRPALLREIHRVLIPGGMFCIVEHNPLNPVTQLIVRRTPVDANAQLLTAGVARDLLAAEALKPIFTEYFLLFPERIYKRAKAVEPLLRRIPLGGQYAVVGAKSLVAAQKAVAEP